MKNIIYFLLFTGCVKAQTGSIGRRLPSTTLFIINGDSNSGGIGSNDSAFSSELGKQRNVFIIDNHTNQFDTLNIGVNNNFGVGIVDSANKHGIELGLANYVDSSKFLVPTYMTKTGFSGAKISTLSTTYWSNFNIRMDSAVAYLNRNLIPFETFMFFSDDINDSNAHVDTTTWKSQLVSYFANIRLTRGTVPIFMPYVPLKSSLDSSLVLNYNIVISHLSDIISDFIPISMTGVYTLVGPHDEYSGFKILAERVVTALKSNYKFQ